MISIVSFSESRGGAAKAAQRYFLALRKRGIDVQYVVVERSGRESLAISAARRASCWHLIKRVIVFVLQKLQISKNPTKHSINLFSCGTVLKAIEHSELIHLNWINNETISLEKLPTIKGGLVITLHDEWFYCGSEHLSSEDNRPFEGYTPATKNVKGIDWNRITWDRKMRALNAIKSRVIFTAPSSWMVDRARNSVLLRDFNVRRVPNCLDTETFRRLFCAELLQEYGVSTGDKVILFSVSNEKNLYLKGFHVLREALSLLYARLANKSKVVLVTFGGKLRKARIDLGFRLIEIGSVTDAAMLAKYYSRADFTIVPSLVESFGQVAAESLSCETPVLAFDYSGLRDIIIHKVNGFLAKPFSAESLCNGMQWLLALKADELRRIGVSGRKHVIKNFSESVVMEKLLAVYCEQGMNNAKGSRHKLNDNESQFPS